MARSQGARLGPERAWYERIQKDVDRLAPPPQGAESPARDLGVQAAWSALVFRVSGDPKYRDRAVQCLDASLRYYDQCFAERKSVNWYSTSRVHATMAWDWLYNDLPETQRGELMRRLIRAIDRVVLAKPPIYRENLSGY